MRWGIHFRTGGLHMGNLGAKQGGGSPSYEESTSTEHTLDTRRHTQRVYTTFPSHLSQTITVLK